MTQLYTILFDLDGTIIEPQQGILNSIRHAAQKMGVEIPATTEMHQFIGPPIMDSFQSKLSLNYEDAIRVLEELGLVATVSGDTNDVVRKQIPRKGEFIEPEGVVELTFGS